MMGFNHHTWYSVMFAKHSSKMCSKLQAPSFVGGSGRTVVGGMGERRPIDGRFVAGTSAYALLMQKRDETGVTHLQAGRRAREEIARQLGLPEDKYHRVHVHNVHALDMLLTFESELVQEQHGEADQRARRRGSRCGRRSKHRWHEETGQRYQRRGTSQTNNRLRRVPKSSHPNYR